jgi:D-3-phosphoglycerate dehydrogenase / 2-oxoglutarate reductase
MATRATARYAAHRSCARGNYSQKVAHVNRSVRCRAHSSGEQQAMKSLFIDCNDQLAPVWAKVFRGDDPPIDVNRMPFAREDLARVLAGYDVALDDHSYMPTALVAQCPQLKHIVFLGTGAASYMNVVELAARGVTVHTIKGYGDTAVAEHTIALMFAAARDIARMDREVRGGRWTPQEGVQLLGKTLGVIGLGGIGCEIARIAAGIGMQVIAYNRTPKSDAPWRQLDIDTLLARADVVSLNLVLNDETRGFLSRERIARMKPGALLVNTARGALVDEAALIEGLQTKHIRHAGLDVFHAEPLKPDHPLTKLLNVTLTSHAAFRTEEASMILLRRAIDIVKTLV